MKTRIGVVLIGLLLVSTATEAGIFLGGSLGEATVEQNVAGIGFEGDDTAVKFFGGFRILRFFAVEGGYIDFGTLSDVLPGNSFETKLTGWNAVAVGTIPIGTRFEIFGKAGLIYWEADTTVVMGSTSNFSDDDFDATYGFGLAFNLTDKILIRGEWESFEIADTDAVELLSAGIEFRF
jgi:OOP family OmpA-OmpF porin